VKRPHEASETPTPPLPISPLAFVEIWTGKRTIRGVPIHRHDGGARLLGRPGAKPVALDNLGLTLVLQGDEEFAAIPLHQEQ
jgi:hypothetical protein